MSQHEVQIRCACIVATIEADERKPFPQVSQAFNTLELLENRVRKLESSFDIHSPPPSVPSTWDALAWRICRLEKKNRTRPGRPYRTPLPRTQFSKLIQDPNDISIELLKSTLSGINKPLLKTGSMCEFPKSADDEQTLDLIRQNLYYMTSQLRCTIDKVPISRAEIYALAADLALEAETNTSWPHVVNSLPPPPPPGARMPPPIIWNLKKKKACCGCCTCDCHDKNGGKTTSSSKWSRMKRALSFSWVKKLACWRRKPVEDDSDDSSTYSSTLAD